MPSPHDPPGTHPNLIDLNTGAEYEWIANPGAGGEPGYANVDDHDWAWSRAELAGVARLAETDQLSPAELAAARAQAEPQD